MSKKKGRPSTGRDDVPVRIPRHLASKAKAIADERGVVVAIVLEEVLSASINRLFVEMVERLNRDHALDNSVQ